MNVFFSKSEVKKEPFTQEDLKRYATFADEKGRIPLHYAVKKNNIKLTEDLLRIEDTIHIKDTNGWNVVHFAAERPKRLMELLLKNFAEASVQNIDGDTPLHLAVKAGNADNVMLLLELSSVRAKINTQNFKTKEQQGLCTALHFAMMSDRLNANIIKALCDKDGDLNLANEKGETPFYLLMQHKDVMALTDFIKEKSQGIMYGLTTQSQATILHAAAKNKYLIDQLFDKIVGHIMTHQGLNIINFVDANGQTALFEAVSAAELEKVRILLKASANTNLYKNTSPLHQACQIATPSLNQCAEQRQYLEKKYEIGELQQKITAASVPNSRDENEIKRLADLLGAAQASVESDLKTWTDNFKNQAEKIALELIRSGADVNANDSKGKTAFEYAVATNKVRVLQKLATKKELKVTEAMKADAVRLAIQLNNDRMLYVLLNEYQADPNTAFSFKTSSWNKSLFSGVSVVVVFPKGYRGLEEGDTPAHYGAKNNHLDIVQACIKNPNKWLDKENTAGKKALFYAVETLNNPIAQELRAAGSKENEDTNFLGQRNPHRTIMHAAAKSNFHSMDEVFTFLSSKDYRLNPEQEEKVKMLRDKECYNLAAPGQK